MRNLVVSLPSAVHGLDWLHGKSGGHQVISIVSPPTHHQQTLDLPHHKDQAALHGADGYTAGSRLITLYISIWTQDRERRGVFRTAHVTTDGVLQ